ncbi:hypothetical protein C4577_05085 [Candidatus Parcubacteria bacterium]|nr:MAG: hypothetical protein C4577_05085 [Candidatus Parcubacteria bacterium]
MIEYNFDKKTVRQTLTTIGTYELDGNFEVVLTKLNEKLLEYVRCYKLDERKITEGNYRGGGYCDGTKEKSVRFDSFDLEYTDYGEYDSSPVIKIWGNRKMLPEEIQAMELKKQEEKTSKEQRDKSDFERLKKQYGWS